MTDAFSFLFDGAIYVFAFLVAILLLVTAHELGHYLVARWAGVKVLAFSVGFGPRLAKWTDKHGTDFVIAAIPFGGYVRMLETKVDEVDPEDWDQTYDRAPPTWRIAIALAGPFANFIFSFLVLCLVFLIYGKPVEPPYIGTVLEDSPAEQAGLQAGSLITTVDGEATATWSDVNVRLIERIGETDPITLSTTEGHHSLLVREWKGDKGDLDIVSSVGFFPGLKPIIDMVGSGSPAERAGIIPGDQIFAINSSRTPNWSDVVSVIQKSAEKSLQVELIRQGENVVVTLVPESTENASGVEVGFANMRVRSSVARENLNVVGSIPVAARETWQLLSVTMTGLYKMVVGDISVRGLGGPITIAKVGGDSVQRGLEVYLRFLAILSIGLGLINLMPVPLLDGGHVVFGVYEMLRREPASDQLQAIAARVGMVLIGGLVILVLYNDSLRVLGL